MTDQALLVDDREIALTVRYSARARYYSLSVDNASGRVVLVVPRRASLKQGLKFAAEKAVWVQNRLALMPARVPFAAGSEIPLFGLPRRIEAVPKIDGGGVVRITDTHIWVKSHDEHLARRLSDWLRREAKRVLGPEARAKAELAGRRVTAIGIRDQRTRWGSCASSGRMSFSWRLLLAPEWVRDYVVAHEVAHLVEMNHSARFWRVVERLTPHTKEGRAWLRRHGESLHRYGPTSG
ncbi:MAG: M48 family metallopeptidase [Alphaproteobacteria bacterium]